MFINELRSLIKSENDAVIIYSEVNRRYFTEFPSSDGYLVVTADDAVFFTDSRYIEAAALAVKDCRTALLRRVSVEIKDYLASKNIRRVITERERLTVAELGSLKKALPDCRILPSQALENRIYELRNIKTQYEIDCINKAQSIAEAAFEHILGFIKPGVTEREIGLELDFYMLSHGAEALSFETIAITGEKTSMPHGVPGDVKVRKGDFITMDYGAVYNGYHSDMTRTVAVGKITAEQKKVYETVLNAQNACLGMLKAGITGKQGDAAARDIIAAAGYGGFFGHSTGHGVGVEIHEKPNLAPSADKIKLKPGNVVTVEPGIYLPARFGVRIEDMALITETGCINLTHTPKELIIL